METVKQQLAFLGLEDKEIEVYLAILSLGKCTITDIAAKSLVKRTTIYAYLESLVARGLVFKTADKKRVLYCAEEPEKIKKTLESERRKLEEKKERLTALVPQLEALYATAFSRPRVSFYEGKEGIRQVYRQILETHRNIFAVFSPDSFFRLFSAHENRQLLELLRDSGGILHSLIEKTGRPNEEIKNKDYEKFIKSKFLPDDFKFETDLLVSGETVALISFKTFIGVIIEDKGVADLQKSLVKALWKSV